MRWMLLALMVFGTSTVQAGEVVPQRQGHVCLTFGEPLQTIENQTLSAQSDQHYIRVFRMAVAATGEFTQYYGGKSEALQAVENIMAKVSAIFEREVGVRFQLVPEVEALVFEDPATDPYASNEPSVELMHEAQETFDSVVGTENYDLGIVLTRGIYGLTQLASVCDPLTKGASSFGLPEPNGDELHVNMIVHELGHQFGAEHTFNSGEGICSDRRREWRAFEPGSGSTLMSYAALACGDDGFQSLNDAYFHSESLKQILDFLRSERAGCATLIPTGNHPPEVHAGPEFTIPIGTPFALTATGFDPDGDEIFYSWEQRDRGPAQGWDDPDNGLSPLFRSYPPTSAPTRFFPAMDYLLANEQAPGEQLPMLDRVMRFRVTARDSQNNGAVSWADTQIFVEASAGPFRITSHAEQEVLRGETDVRWDVAGTSLHPVGAHMVRITLSVDGGKTFPHVLVEETANDGTERVLLPPMQTGAARIKVAAVDNIFFDVNDADLVLESDSIRIQSVEQVGKVFVLRWPSIPGAKYRIERAGGPGGVWSVAAEVEATSETSSVEVPIDAQLEFFRLIQE